MSGLNDYDAEIRRLYLQEKMSDEEVAQALPIEATAKAISSYRYRYGIKGHRRGPKSSLDSHRDEIVHLYTVGKVADWAIAEKFGVTAEAIRRARIRWGVTTDRNKKTGRFSMEARYEEIKDQLPGAWERSKRWHRRQQRMVGSAQRVADEFGVGMSTAQKWLARLGLVESRSVHSPGASTEAVELFDSGLSVPAVARKLGCPEDTVRAWIAKERNLSNPGSRRSYEEQLAFRRSISAGKAAALAGSGRYNYNGVRLDSTLEVRFARNCDRLGITWQTYDRAAMGVISIDMGDDLPVNYGPDFVVKGLHVEVKGVYDATAAAKVTAWRQQRGELAMIMKQELLDLEEARSEGDAFAILQAACYLEPPTDPAYWD